jgi:hypothetical protein
MMTKPDGEYAARGDPGRKIHALRLYPFGRFPLINIVSPSNNELWIDAVAL